MASFNRAIITNKGMALIAKSLINTDIKFTKIRTSEKDYSTVRDLENIISIENVKQTELVSEANVLNNSTVQVIAPFTNTLLTTGYYLRTIGLYANDPDEGEILYSITTAIMYDWIPPFSSISVTSFEVKLSTVISNSNNLDLTINPEAVVNISQFNKFKESVTAQLSDMEQQKNFQTKAKKTICSIIFDDGWIWDYTMVLPYFKEKGIVGNTAVFTNAIGGTNYCTSGFLKTLQKEGWSILSHTKQHFVLPDYGYDIVDYNCRESKKDLEALGLKCDYIVYPTNKYDLKTLEIVRKYYKGAFAKSYPTDDSKNMYNTTPFNQYAMYRIHAETPLAQLKPVIDEAIANNGYIVLMGHSMYYGDKERYPDAEAVFGRLKENIQYLIDQGVEIMNVDNAMDLFGNLVTIGDEQISGKYTFVSKDGSIKSSDLMHSVINGLGKNNNTPVAEYPKNTVSTLNFSSSSNSGFPLNNAGTLLTYRLNSGFSNDELSFQIWYPFGNPEVFFKRVWLSAENRWFVWQEFKSESSKNKIQLNQNSLSLQHQYTMSYDVEGLLQTSYISLIPNVELPDNVIMQASIPKDGVLKVKLYNLTSNNIEISSLKYNLLIFK